MRQPPIPPTDGTSTTRCEFTAATDTQAPSAGLLVERLGGRYSKALGIDLESGRPDETFKWLLAAILFGARISETLAVRTWHELMRQGLTAPQRILDRGWDGLVAILDRGGYVRYDFKTASKLIEVANRLVERYGGDVTALHRAADDPADLERRIQSLAGGIGEVTANIFLREMRGIWNKADPSPSGLALAAAKSCRLLPSNDVTDERQALQRLQAIWQGEGHPSSDFADFEAALVRLGLKHRREKIRRHRS